MGGERKFATSFLLCHADCCLSVGARGEWSMHETIAFGRGERKEIIVATSTSFNHYLTTPSFFTFYFQKR